MVENCENCAFWGLADLRASTGECHRRAPGGPYPFKENGTTMVDIWPHTYATDFCGEWELKDANSAGNGS